MRSLPALLTCALLCAGLGGCGGAGGTQNSRSAAAAAAAHGAALAAAQNPSGNDDDIPAYGKTASAADRAAITVLVRRYYAAAANEDGVTACSLLVPKLARAIPEDYGSGPGSVLVHGNSCAEVATKLFERLGKRRRAALAATDITGVRVFRDSGFAELRSPMTPKGEVFVEREDGRWGLGVLLGRARAGP